MEVYISQPVWGKYSAYLQLVGKCIEYVARYDWMDAYDCLTRDVIKYVKELEELLNIKLDATISLIDFTANMIKKGNYDFSLSGLRKLLSQLMDEIIEKAR